MKRRFPVLVIVMVVAMATGSAIFAYREASLTSKRSRTTTSVTTFINAIQHANDARFVATYRLRSYLFFSSGTIVIAQIPSPPGTRATTNADGYSGSGRYAYLFRGSTGRIIQWIKIGTNVSVRQRSRGRQFRERHLRQVAVFETKSLPAVERFC